MIDQASEKKWPIILTPETYKEVFEIRGVQRGVKHFDAAAFLKTGGEYKEVLGSRFARKKSQHAAFNSVRYFLMARGKTEATASDDWKAVAIDFNIKSSVEHIDGRFNHFRFVESADDIYLVFSKRDATNMVRRTASDNAPFGGSVHRTGFQRLKLDFGRYIIEPVDKLEAMIKHNAQAEEKWFSLDFHSEVGEQGERVVLPVSAFTIAKPKAERVV